MVIPILRGMRYRPMMPQLRVLLRHPSLAKPHEANRLRSFASHVQGLRIPSRDRTNRAVPFLFRSYPYLLFLARAEGFEPPT